MAFEPLHVPSFGGGLDFATNPAALPDNAWSWADGWIAKYGCAEILPQYVQVKAAGWLTGGYSVIGILPNPYSLTAGALVVSVNGSAIKWYTLTDAGTTVQITFSGADSGGGAQDVDAGSTAGVPTAAFLNGFHVITTGAKNGSWSLLRWTGGATYVTIKPPTLSSLKADFLASFQAHLLAATSAQTQTGCRTINISAVNDTDTWLTGVAATDIGNDSDQVLLDDVTSGITAMVPMGTATMGLWTRDLVMGLSATGSIPPFTRQFLGLQGCLDIPAAVVPQFHSYAGLTPMGPLIRGVDDFYLGDTGVAQKIIRYWNAATGTIAYAASGGGGGGAGGGGIPMPQWHWHRAYGAAIIPSLNIANTAHEVFLFDPNTKVWSRRSLPTAGGTLWFRHAMILDNHNGAMGAAAYRHWIITGTGLVYAEDSAGGAQAGAFVDTKDFTFGDPTAGDYVSRLHIEWEPLTNATTDALDVLAYVHDDPSKGILGSPGLQTDFSANFVAVGTLTGGASELACRLQGKYIRLRFKQNSGRVRIRGFSLIHQRGPAKAA